MTERKKRPGRYGKVYSDILTEGKLAHLMTLRGGRASLGSWALGLALTAKELSNGVIQPHELRTIHATPADTRNLVTVGLWDIHERGWYYHDYVEGGFGITQEDVDKLKRDGEVSACKGRVAKGRECTCGEHQLPEEPPDDGG